MVVLDIEVNSLEGTKDFGNILTKVIEPGLLMCLYGPIGSGKTTFVKYLCKELGVTEEVTSPSFVIINEYYSGRYPIYHFDLYRLENEGVKSILAELEEYSSDKNALTFIEWAEFSQNNLLDDRIDMSFSYDENFSDYRKIQITSCGYKADAIVERLREKVANRKF